jgi:hypothetical protein
MQKRKKLLEIDIEKKKRKEKGLTLIECGGEGSTIVKCLSDINDYSFRSEVEDDKEI